MVPSGVAYGLVLLVAAITQTAFVGRSSLSLDESVSTTLATAPWHRFADVVAHREVNQVLYYLVLRPWMALGHGPGAARALSVVAGLGATALAMVVARRLFDRRTALVAGLLMAVNPWVVQFAQTARGYSLSLMLVTASSALFVVGIRRAVDDGRWGWGLWVAYVAVSALASYANFWAALVPVAQGMSLAFVERDRLPWKRLASVAAVLAVLLVPLALLIRATDNAGVNWAAGSAAGRVFTKVRGLVPHTLIDLAALVVVAAALALLVVASRRHAGRRLGWPVAFVLSWMLVPIALVVLVSVTDKPVFVVRYLLVCLPPLFILVAAGLVRLPRPALVGAVAVLSVLSLVGVARWYSTGGPQDWRDAVAYMAGHARPGDGVLVFAPYMRLPVEWYVDQHPALAAATHPVYPALGWGVDPLRFDAYVPESASLVARAAAPYPRVWLAVSQAGLYPQQYAELRAGLADAGLRTVGSRSFAGVDLVLLDHAVGR